jgi:hypothetical protein
MAPKGHFENRSLRLLDGQSGVVPIYLSSHGEPLPESSALIKAVQIIGSTLGREGYLDLDQLVDEMGRILTSPDQKDGIIIEDEGGIGSVLITAEKTTVSERGVGEHEIANDLVFDMLYTWSGIDSPKP